MTFTFPKLSALGKKYGIKDAYGAGYGQLVQKTLELVKKKHKNFTYDIDYYPPPTTLNCGPRPRLVEE